MIIDNVKVYTPDQKFVEGGLVLDQDRIEAVYTNETKPDLSGKEVLDGGRAGETWPPDLAEFVALISESGANPFGLTVAAVLGADRRWRDESWGYDGSDKYPWPQPVLYHICLEMRTRGIERQMTQGELKRLAERQLTKWAKHVGNGMSVPPVRRQLEGAKHPQGPTPIERLKQEYERRKAAGFI